MNDLETSRNIIGTNKGADIPESYDKSQRVENVSFPNLQNAIESYGEAKNWMSSIGSYVATQASNQIASKIGTEMGKNPQGDISLPITDFDKTMQQSYERQAQSTLAIRANKLITDSNLTIAKSPRVTPDMIGQANNNISLGLQNIFKNAPSNIKPELEYQFGHVQQAEYESMTKRMISEQREDERNHLAYSSQLNSENSYTLAKSGNFKAAQVAFDSVSKNAKAAFDKRLIDESTAKNMIDSARQTYLTGKKIYEYNNAKAQGKDAEYLKNLAENQGDLSDNDYIPVTNNLMQYVNHQQGLRNQYEQYQSQLMDNKIAKDPILINQSDFDNFASQVSPIKAEQMKYKWIQALKEKQSAGEDVNTLIANWDDPRSHANASEKIQNAAFNKQVAYAMNQNPNLSIDEAETSVAASAGAPIPVFTKTIKNELWSGDPVKMDAAVVKIHNLSEIDAGHALSGLNDQDKAMFAEYEALRNPADPTSAAKMVINAKQSFEPEILKITDAKWSNLVYNNTNIMNLSTDQWILNTFTGGRHQPSFTLPYLQSTYAGDIYQKYKSFYTYTRGDDTIARRLTNDYVQANYGTSKVNGDEQWTLHPIEKLVNVSGHDGVLAIHKDIVRQLQPKLDALKSSYNEHTSNTYFEIEAPQAGKPLMFIKHERAELGETVKKYPAVLVGTNFNDWDISLNTDYGYRNLYLDSPMLGVTSYSPDIKWIQDEYNGNYHFFPKERIGKLINERLNNG